MKLPFLKTVFSMLLSQYDAKQGVYDWDYHMRLHDFPFGSRINSREYCKWRDSGIAFTWLETELSEVNQTLASAVCKIGDRLCHHGFLGDMHNAPYINYSLECEDTDMVESTNGICSKRAADIMERNLLRLFWEMEHNDPYIHPKEDQIPNLGVIVTELTELPTDVKEKLPEDEDAQLNEDVIRKLNIKEPYTSIELLSDVNITFLSTSSLNDLPKKDKFKNHFHIIWFAQNLHNRMQPDLISLVVDNGFIMVENKLYLVTRSKEDLTKHEEHLNGIFNRSMNCSYFKKYNCNSDFNAKFVVKRN